MKTITLDMQFEEVLAKQGIGFEKQEGQSVYIIEGPVKKVEIFLNDESEFELEIADLEDEFTGTYGNLNFEVDMYEVINMIHDYILSGVRW